jgi:hypothetical protein
VDTAVDKARGSSLATALVIAVGASSATAIAVTIRAVTGERLARRAVPFLVLAPTDIWAATSMDAFFLGVAAWGVALTARAGAAGGKDDPHPPWGAIPLLWSRPVDRGNRWFHSLWITTAHAAADAIMHCCANACEDVTRGEVERIRLPYAAWMTTAAAVYRPPASRIPLVQAVTALPIQALVRSPW